MNSPDKPVRAIWSHDLYDDGMCQVGLIDIPEHIQGKWVRLEDIQPLLEELNRESARLDWLTKRGGMAVDYHTLPDGRKSNAYHFGSSVFTNDGLRAAVDAAMEVEASQGINRDKVTVKVHDAESILESIRAKVEEWERESRFLAGPDDRPEDYAIGKVYHDLAEQIKTILS